MASDERSKPTRILVGVTGGIAAYKAPELVRRLVDAGCEVQVVMTAGAKRFVAPRTFQAVSSRPVRDDLWDEAAEAAMGHIELARWAELVVVAPATADFMSRYAHGAASDLLSTICLATEAPVLIAPAMNRVMWQHAAVQANRRLLEERGVHVLGPAAGAQACGEHGLGRMVEPGDIVDAVVREPAWLRPRLLAGVRTVVTAGPTREAIDPVRYITNRSSGKMGFAIAGAAREAGADVVLIAGPVSLPTPPGVKRIDVETAEQMYRTVHAEIGGAKLFIGCAAVSDYRPESPSAAKIKRSSEKMQLDLVRSADTLASVAALPGAPFTVGFAAETDDVERHARDKLARKGIDMIAANRVGPGCGFDQETNALTLFWHGGELELGESSKIELGRKLIAAIAERYGATRTDPQPTTRAG